MRHLKNIGDAIDETIQMVIVDQRIASLVVAERSVETIGNRIENDDVVRIAGQGERTREPQLERHVESCRLTSAAEIVDGYCTGAKKLVNAGQSPLAPLTNLQHTARHLSQGDESADDSDEIWLVCCVEWNVEEDRLGIECRRDHSAVLGGTTAGMDRDPRRLGGSWLWRLPGRLCNPKSSRRHLHICRAHSDRTENLTGRSLSGVNLSGAQTNYRRPLGLTYGWSRQSRLAHGRYYTPLEVSQA
jgi:hypothetical protein